MNKERFDVRFFKRLITFSVIFIILCLLVFTIYFKAQNRSLKQDIAELEAAKVNASSLESLDYQSKYPNMYVDSSKELVVAENTIYLTFDDGPATEITGKILDVLKKNNVKATFFVVYKDTEEAKALIRRAIDEGHTIGVHTATHNYKKIYKSVSAYLKDFHKVQAFLKNEFDYDAKIFRFPGGSVNAYNLACYDRIIPEMYRRGYTFYDWNVSSGDAASIAVSSSEIVNNVVTQAKRNSRSIVLMHDAVGKNTTLEALPTIIKRLKKEGYKFAALDNSVQPIIFTAGQTL